MKIHPSASLMLEISREELIAEKERSNTLDSKANVFMSAIIAVITIFIPIIPFSKILLVYMSAGKLKIIATTVLLCVLVVAAIFMIIAFKNLYQSFKLKPFVGVNYENLNNLSLLKKPIDVAAKAMVDHYNQALETNLNINDEKAKKIASGLRYSVVSFVLLCISAIGLITLLGGDKNV